MIENTIIQAISETRYLTVTYNGQSRSIIPASYGLDKTGAPKLRAYQVDSVTGSTDGWRLFNVNALVHVSLSDKRFVTPITGYNKTDPVMTTVLAQL